jgi:uncharacterized protein YoaH (UPF0181 family)
MTREELVKYWAMVDQTEYERRVQELEAEGCDRGDAQAIVEAEMLEEVGSLRG